MQEQQAGVWLQHLCMPLSGAGAVYVCVVQHDIKHMCIAHSLLLFPRGLHCPAQYMDRTYVMQQHKVPVFQLGLDLWRDQVGARGGVGCSNNGGGSSSRGTAAATVAAALAVAVAAVAVLAAAVCARQVVVSGQGRMSCMLCCRRSSGSSKSTSGSASS